ncbi:MAG: sugar nucleotide-binding protein [Cellvibrionaceae bacterium]
MITKVLLISCGDIAIRLARLLPPDRFRCHGLRRRPERLPFTIEGIGWDLSRAEGLAERIADFEVVVITPVPSSRDAAGYRRAYVGNMQNIVAGLEAASAKAKLTLFVSSTSVYGQNQGEWVDENSPTEPSTFRGQAVLGGEELVRNSTLDSCIVRFSGIYGPGREHLINQVRRGDFGAEDEGYSNRIHADDCAGVLSHLIQRKLNGEDMESLYLASDCEPAPLADVKWWLAKQMGFPVGDQPDRIELCGNKRCSNERLLGSGYEFKYPSFQEGYAELMDSR